MNKIDNQFCVFYDGGCYICSQEINWLRKKTQKKIQLSSNKDDILWIDIADPCFDKNIYKVNFDQLQKQIHVYDCDRFLTGMDALRALYQKVGLGYMINWTKYPGFKQLSDVGYQLFARNRGQISNVASVVFRKSKNNCKDTDKCG